MRFRCRRSPRVAMVLICGCALVSLYRFQHKAWHAYATEPRSVAEQFVARYEPLRWLMPATAVTGFLADDAISMRQSCTPRDGCTWRNMRYRLGGGQRHGVALGYRRIRLSGNRAGDRHVGPLDSVGGPSQRRSAYRTGVKE